MLQIHIVFVGDYVSKLAAPFFIGTLRLIELNPLRAAGRMQGLKVNKQCRICRENSLSFVGIFYAQNNISTSREANKVR